MNIPKTTLKYDPITEFPSIIRDISLALPKNVPYQSVHDLCVKHGGDILHKVSLVEEYVGDKIPQGQRGLVLSLVYQSKERTLREDDVNAVHPKVLEALSRECLAQQR